MKAHSPLPSQVADRRLWQIQPLRDLTGLIVIGLVIWLIIDLRRFFAPVFIAFALAYLVEPMIEALQKRTGLPRWAPALVCTLLLTAGLVLAVIWVGPLLAEQGKTLATHAPQYISTLEKRYGFNVGNLSDHLSTFAEGVKDKPMDTLSPLFTGTSQAVGIVGLIVATTLEVLLSTLLVPIFFFLFAWHFDQVRSRIRPLIPGGRGAKARRILHRMDEAVSGFIRGRLLIAILSAIAFTAGWTWAGIPYALLLGIVTGALTVVPYLSVAGWPVALLVKYLDLTSSGGAATWQDIVLWPSVVFLFVAFLEGWVLTPWIQSQTMEMSALTILLVVLVGGAIGGVLGLLLAIPLMACANVLIEELWLKPDDVQADPT
jgi:predicted PurR-regulated permease PerM